MKNILKYIKKQIFFTLILFCALFIFTMCVTISGVNQPTTATVGEQINITIDVSVNPAENSSQNVVLGVLAPVAWDFGSNATATFTSDNGNGTFSLDAGANATTFDALLGIGENYGEVEWVAFVSNEQVTGANGVGFTGQVQLTLTVGDENINTQLAYAVVASGHVSDGNIGSFFTPCFEVTGGTNELIDLCGPIPYPVQYQPTVYSTEDIIKINFDATKADNRLVDATQVYICASAMVDGNLVEVCDNSAATMMNNLGDNQWDISIWARGLFNVTDNSPITDIMYSFTNEAGDINIQDPNTLEDFVIVDNCN